MIINLGVGLKAPISSSSSSSTEAGNDGATNVDLNEDDVKSEEGDGEERQGAMDVNGEQGLGEDDYGALALLDTVVEEREERLSNEDVGSILTIIRLCLGQTKEDES